MSKTGFTTLPCPGCGQKNERKRDSVCPDCLEMIQTGKEHVKLYNELKSDKDMVECQRKSREHLDKYAQMLQTDAYIHFENLKNFCMHLYLHWLALLKKTSYSFQSRNRIMAFFNCRVRSVVCSHVVLTLLCSIHPY